MSSGQRAQQHAAFSAQQGGIGGVLHGSMGSYQMHSGIAGAAVAISLSRAVQAGMR